jgi:hypothetical protein
MQAALNKQRSAQRVCIPATVVQAARLSGCSIALIKTAAPNHVQVHTGMLLHAMQQLHVVE